MRPTITPYRVDERRTNESAILDRLLGLVSSSGLCGSFRASSKSRSIALQPKTGFGIFQNVFQNSEMRNPIYDTGYKLFRKMLTEIRIAKGLLQSEMAEKLGKHQPMQFVNQNQLIRNR